MIMQGEPKRLTAWCAIVAIALQAILTGFAGSDAAAAPIDAAAIICHSDPSDAAGTPIPPATSTDCCTKCVLCQVMATGNPFVSTAGVPHLTISNAVAWAARPAGHFRAGVLGVNLPRGPPVSV